MARGGYIAQARVDLIARGAGQTRPLEVLLEKWENGISAGRGKLDLAVMNASLFAEKACLTEGFVKLSVE